MPTLYVTAPRAAAEDLADLVVTDRLAACVNVVECTSTYRWEGEVQEEEEAILLVKTTGEACERLMERIVSAHPHNVPCVERFEESRVAGPFARWRDEVVD